MEKKATKKEWLGLIIGFIGIMLGCLLVRLLNRYLLMAIPLIPRMITMVVSYWLCALAPIVLLFLHKDRLSDYGFTKDGLLLQIVIGLGIGLLMSVFFTLVPHLFGFGGFVDNGYRYVYVWQFIFEFIYCTAGVAAAEEFGFRGFIYKRIKKISGDKDIFAILGSSVLFGLFHIFGGNIFQVFITMLIGLFFCFLRWKIKKCSTLSLIICHGVYDAMITVWASEILG
ncbi:MAG: CPBP family intramembrane metalloprotease [Lachnospiraceae bacterium]|nr:CPBP family intramembrane metalloprotease [Lachnospiraceae bacterium]